MSYERVVDHALTDGVIDHRDHQALRDMQDALGLSDEEAAAILKEGHARAPKGENCPHCGKPLKAAPEKAAAASGGG